MKYHSSIQEFYLKFMSDSANKFTMKIHFFQTLVQEENHNETSIKVVFNAFAMALGGFDSFEERIVPSIPIFAAISGLLLFLVFFFFVILVQMSVITGVAVADIHVSNKC